MSVKGLKGQMTEKQAKVNHISDNKSVMSYYNVNVYTLHVKIQLFFICFYRMANQDEH